MAPVPQGMQVDCGDSVVFWGQMHESSRATWKVIMNVNLAKLKIQSFHTPQYNWDKISTKQKATKSRGFSDKTNGIPWINVPEQVHWSDELEPSATVVSPSGHWVHVAAFCWVEYVPIWMSESSCPSLITQPLPHWAWLTRLSTQCSRVTDTNAFKIRGWIW